MGLTKATLTNLDSNEKIECLFNPTEYTIAKSNTWQAKPIVGKNVPKLDFTGGGSRTLSLQLMFDVFEQSGADVRTHIDKLWTLTMIDEAKKSSETNRSRPPLCLFQWGGTWHFKAAITSLSVRYTLFRQDGTPVRAIATVSLEEAADDSDQPGTNPTSYSPSRMRRREVRPKDTLALIAFEEYGDSSKWRPIAEANQIDDPMEIVPGQILAIPGL
ncbi:MAG TPA: LysM peptidoglycan-binding domain-containing protein [Fimbriimonadaceae bacterium]|nr:LysM peptidoglycan-binding domain-containing protein [Fimbriimonadaceae bacterium]